MAGIQGASESRVEAGGLSARVLRSRRRSVSLELTRELDLLIRAPHSVSVAFIKDFLERRRAWVERHRGKLEAARESEPSWEDGSSFPLLGEALTLRVLPGSRNAARLMPGEIRATVADPADGDSVRKAVERLLSREAAARFPAFIDSCLSLPAAKRLARPELRIRSMKSRWGSCDPAKRVVTLNSQLMRFEPEVVEYVICHELAHLRHRRHDERFYAFLSELCPGWKAPRKRLSGVYLD